MIYIWSTGSRQEEDETRLLDRIKKNPPNWNDIKANVKVEYVKLHAHLRPVEVLCISALQQWRI